MSNEDTTATETAALATVEPAELAPATMSILPAQKMTLQQIAVARPQAMDAFVEAMASAARNLRKAAFALVDPEDFVLSRDREGNETAMLAGPGAQKIAPLLGIAITNLRGPGGQPVSEPVYENGTAVIIGDIESRVLGTVLESVRAERDASEGFAGRAGNRGDLKSAANTLLLSKGVRTMLGMSRIPLAVLKENGIDVARCRRGHGYGSSGERQAGTVPTGTSSGAACVPFGKMQGTPVTDLKDAQLDWYVKAARENIDNPEKAKWRAKETAWLKALTDEQGRRRMGDAPPDDAPEPGSQG